MTVQRYPDLRNLLPFPVTSHRIGPVGKGLVGERAPQEMFRTPGYRCREDGSLLRDTFEVLTPSFGVNH